MRHSQQIVSGIIVKQALDSDRALVLSDDDHFGFVGIAAQLATAIIEASQGDGMVIGLEGRWGSGKTSLLNFLTAELEKVQSKNIHTIKIAPWLDGDASSLVMSLLAPISLALQAEQDKVSRLNGESNAIHTDAIDVSKMVLAYGQKTARRFAPLARFAGYVVPGGQLLGDMMDAGADALEQFVDKGVTTTELKKSIIEKLQQVDIGFVVILDDLDRLEPSQAVEVVRLVRSVADFPKVVYLMCYDRTVLANALKTGLNVEDGDLFLQKIVQLTFAIPLPEPFDLRQQFLKGASELYQEVNNQPADGDLLDDLKSAVDFEGMNLSMPREVKLALNAIRFVYRGIVADVYFPDLCRLHLIKIANYKLYQWLEEYLSTRSVLVTGDGVIYKETKSDMGKRLQEILPSEEVGSLRSIWHLKKYIPGVSRVSEPEKCVFGEVSMRDTNTSIQQRRLGSPLHYRFYFALTGPKTVIPEAKFRELLNLAKDNPETLITRLNEYAVKTKASGKTWFEHILNRLDKDAISRLELDTLVGLVHGFSDTMDTVLAADTGPRAFDVSVEQRAIWIVENCLDEIGQKAGHQKLELAKWMARDGRALNWLIGRFFRNQMFTHGRVGDRPSSSDEWVFTNDELDQLVQILKERLAKTGTQDLIASLPDLPSYLFGWMNIAGNDDAKAWAESNSKTDHEFLKLLRRMRGWMISDKVYYPLSQSTVSPFLDWDASVERLQAMLGGEFDAQARDLQQAIQLSRD